MRDTVLGIISVWCVQFLGGYIKWFGFFYIQISISNNDKINLIWQKWDWSRIQVNLLLLHSTVNQPQRKSHINQTCAVHGDDIFQMVVVLVVMMMRVVILLSWPLISDVLQYTACTSLADRTLLIYSTYIWHISKLLGFRRQILIKVHQFSSPVVVRIKSQLLAVISNASTQTPAFSDTTARKPANATAVPVATPVASFTNEVNSRLATRPLVFNGRLANLGLTSFFFGGWGWGVGWGGGGVGGGGVGGVGGGRCMCVGVSVGMGLTRFLTHLPIVPHICVSELGQHWFR